MNEQRKKMIISEIKYWKESKMLPEHYCDFLITLYGQGEEDEAVGRDSASILVKEKKKINRTIGFLLVLAVALSANLFIPINLPVGTLGLTAVLIFIYLFYAIRGTRKKSRITPFLYISSAFMLLAMSLKLWLAFFEDKPMLLISFLMLNCILWLVAGRLLKLFYFTISGGLGILLIIIFLLL